MNIHVPPFTPEPESSVRPDRDFRVREIGALIQRRAGQITLTTLVVVLLAALYVLQVRTQYTASSEVMLDPRKSSVENSASVLSSLPADQPTILNQIEILNSYRFSANVVDRFHLEQDPEFASQGIIGMLFPSHHTAREIAIAKLRERIKVSQAGFSSTIRISVKSTNRQKATELASAMAAMYVQEQLDIKAQASHQASGWLTQRVTELAQKVKDAEAAVQKYKAEHRISTTVDGTSVTEQQLTELNGQLTVAQTEYDDKVSKATHTDQLLKAGQIASAPQVVASPLITALRTQQSELNREIANLTARYGPNHPKMKELAAQRTDLEAKISQEALRIADSIRNDAETSRTHVSSLQKNLHQVEELNARKNEDAVGLIALQSAASSTRAMYQAFLSQYSQIENQQGILRPDAYVISNAEVEETFPPKTKMLAILSAIPSGFLLGLALAFLSDRGPVGGAPIKMARAPSQQASLMLPAVGPGQRAADLVVTNPQSPFAVALSGLLSSVLGHVVPPSVVVITSAVPGAGKTTLTLALARAAACAGIKTIAIDANRPSCHLGMLLGKMPTNVYWPYALATQISVESFINMDPLSPALVMASDPALPGYENLLTPTVLTQLVAGLKTSFDLVLIVAPPHPDTLAPAIMNLADMMVVAADSKNPRNDFRLKFRRPNLTVLTNAR
jgi:uncharacterized protein involved in exopolysaccharide biosynthesis/Mrp family chromosome partitioning ATPase